MRTLLVILAIILIVLSLVICIINPIIGIIGIVAGILLIVFRKKIKTKKEIEAEQEQARAAEMAQKMEEIKEQAIKEANAKQAEHEKISAIPRFDFAVAAEPKKRNKEYPSPQFSNITPKGKFLDFVVFDTETTGLSPASDRIVELAAVKFSGGLPVEVFHTYINPGRAIPEKATKINGITDADVADAPKIGEVIESFDKFVGNNLLVAHNLDFDLKFIHFSGSEILNGKNRLIDTYEQAQKMLKAPSNTFYRKRP